MQLVFLPVLGIDREFDEERHRLSMDPMLNLFRWSLEPVEPQVLARRLFAEPLASGPRPDILWQFGDLDESLGTAVPDALVATLGIPASGEFPFAVVEPATGSLTANVSTPEGDVTAEAWRYGQAGHGMLGSRNQSSAYEPPIMPPFVQRAERLDFVNPIDRTHAQIATFFETRITDGRATIAAPE